MNICTNKDSENERNLIKAENNLSASEELKLWWGIKLFVGGQSTSAIRRIKGQKWLFLRRSGKYVVIYVAIFVEKNSIGLTMSIGADTLFI